MTWQDVSPATALAMKLELWARDRWRWVRECVWTQDEADGGAVKRIPEKEYLAHVCRTFRKHPVTAIPKSRRMMLSWIMLALHLHLALFQPRSAIFVQSKKQTDSAYLIGDARMMFIYRHLPDGVPWPRVRARKNELTFSNGSMVRAVGEGPEQLRQYTITAILCDEFAFWARARSSWTAIRPALQGGGTATLVSSAAPGFFASMVEGRME